MKKPQQKSEYAESIIYNIKKNADIRYVISKNHEKICTLLNDKAKKFLEVDWIRYQLHKEAEILMRIPYITKSKEKNLWLDYTNIKNIEKAFDYIRSPSALKTKLTHLEIIDIHRRLANKTKIEPGRYRISNGVFLMGTDISTPDYNRINFIMDDIAFRLTNEESHKDYLTRALDFHYEMFAAQPFDDFNKRTARVVMNWFLLQHQCEPILFNYKTDYKNYALALIARAHGDCRTYNKYMLNCLVRTQENIIKILKKHAISH